jgi:hypothetical protein
VIDSTAPHAEEAELVGARDTLIDLGAFWNSDGLYESSEKIENLTQKKKLDFAQYSIAIYNYLKSESAIIE